MNFQYLEHLEVEFLNSNSKLKELVFSIGENSAERSSNYEEKVAEEKKVQRVIYSKNCQNI